MDVMRKFKMPFLESILENGQSIKLEEDLLHRGWAEILTGKRGDETGAFYMAPALDGSHRCTTSFSMKNLEGREDIVPMWKYLDQRQKSYVIMNVPTTTPVPSVKTGVVVGSAGGGLNKVEGLPENLVSDSSARQYLSSAGYIVDIRIPNTDYEKTDILLSDLVVMEEKRTECFIGLCEQRKPEFGFLVNRGVTIIEYLARSEIESYEAHSTMSEFMPAGGEKPWIHKRLEEHFTSLDKQMRKLYDRLKPEHFIITADHGNVPHKYRANITPFLVEKGYLKSKRSGGLISFARKAKNALGLASTTSNLSKRLTPKARDSLSNYDWSRSMAFGSTYIPGVFINDSKRFNGPVSESDIGKLVDEICSEFNSLPERKRISMVAVPYRRKFEAKEFTDKLPDIKFNGAEGVFFDDQISELVVPNSRYGPLTNEVSDIVHAAHTGDKGPSPLLVLKSDLKISQSGETPRDLTTVYDLFTKIMA